MARLAEPPGKTRSPLKLAYTSFEVENIFGSNEVGLALILLHALDPSTKLLHELPRQRDAVGCEPGRSHQDGRHHMASADLPVARPGAAVRAPNASRTAALQRDIRDAMWSLRNWRATLSKAR